MTTRRVVGIILAWMNYHEIHICITKISKLVSLSFQCLVSLRELDVRPSGTIGSTYNIGCCIIVLTFEDETACIFIEERHYIYILAEACYV